MHDEKGATSLFEKSKSSLYKKYINQKFDGKYMFGSKFLVHNIISE